MLWGGSIGEVVAAREGIGAGVHKGVEKFG
jgi:hypothetical protein